MPLVQSPVRQETQCHEHENRRRVAHASLKLDSLLSRTPRITRTESMTTMPARRPHAATPNSTRRSKREDRPRRNREETRNRILAAAFAEFSQKGFSGARIEAIARKAPSNVRMIYHYFGGKAPLYVAVLEHGLHQLRVEEQGLSVTAADPIEGLLKLFDFVFAHFAAHPELVSLLSSENLHKAAFLKRSRNVPKMSSPTIGIITTLLKRAARSKRVGETPDPLQLYVTMVALSYFHLSNAHTLSVIFRKDLLDPRWIRDRHQHTRAVLLHHLRATL